MPQPSSDASDRLFRDMENLLRDYANGSPLASSVQSAEDQSAPRDIVQLPDAIAAGYMLAGYIAASADPAGPGPDPGHGAAMLMVLLEYIRPLPSDLVSLRYEADIQEMVNALRAAGA
jgi:hypothetical protein